MMYEYDFEMVKRAYAEMARRAREKEEVRSVLPPPQSLQRQAPERQNLPT